MSVVMEGRSRGGLPLSVILLEILPAALAVALLVVVGLLHVASRTAVVTMGYELSRLDQQYTELSREHDALKLELATWKSPARLEAQARAKLGMALPATAAVLHVQRP